jgi:flagellar hook protein FlgE
VNTLVAQRAYSAGARLVATSDAMLAELMRRRR